MGLILSEPMQKVMEIPKLLAKFSVEDENFTQNALIPAPAHRPGEKGENKTNKTSAVFSQKTPFFGGSPVFLPALFVLATKQQQARHRQRPSRHTKPQRGNPFGEVRATGCFFESINTLAASNGPRSETAPLRLDPAGTQAQRRRGRCSPPTAALLGYTALPECFCRRRLYCAHSLLTIVTLVPSNRSPNAY
jgi:hypothetical protein